MPATREDIARLDEAYRFVKQAVGIATTRDLDLPTIYFEFIRQGFASLFALDSDEITGLVRKTINDFQGRVAVPDWRGGK